MSSADFPSFRAVKAVPPKPDSAAIIPIAPRQMDLEQLLTRLEQLPEAEQAWEIERWSEQQRQQFPDLLPEWRKLLATQLAPHISLDSDEEMDLDAESQAQLYPDQADPALIAALYSQIDKLNLAQDSDD